MGYKSPIAERARTVAPREKGDTGLWILVYSVIRTCAYTGGAARLNEHERERGGGRSGERSAAAVFRACCLRAFGRY